MEIEVDGIHSPASPVGKEQRLIADNLEIPETPNGTGVVSDK